MRVSYLKWDCKLSTGSRGLSLTIVVPVPPACTETRVVGLFSMNTFTLSRNSFVSLRFAVTVTDTTDLGGTTPLLGSILQHERFPACKRSQT